MAQERHLFLAGTLGFCSGVRRALEILEQELAAGHTPLYVLHEIIHNSIVVERFRARGVRFVDDPAEVPDGAYLVLSAHGTAPALREQAASRLHVIDTVCPSVRKVQLAAAAAEQAGERIILLGYPEHPEVAGIIGHCSPGAVEVVTEEADWGKLAPDDGRPVCFLAQTSLNSGCVLAAGRKAAEIFAHVQNRAEVCSVVSERQEAVRRLAKQVDFMLILGSAHSSNSRRLLETALQENIPARMVEAAEEIRLEELAGVCRLGLSAGASVPDELITRAVEYLRLAGFAETPLP